MIWYRRKPLPRVGYDQIFHGYSHQFQYGNWNGLVNFGQIKSKNINVVYT